MSPEHQFHRAEALEIDWSHLRSLKSRKIIFIYPLTTAEYAVLPIVYKYRLYCIIFADSEYITFMMCYLC